MTKVEFTNGSPTRPCKTHRQDLFGHQGIFNYIKKIWISSFPRKMRKSDDIRTHILAWQQLPGAGNGCFLLLGHVPTRYNSSFMLLIWASFSDPEQPREVGKRDKRAAWCCACLHVWTGKHSPAPCLGFIWPGRASSHPILLTASQDSAQCHALKFSG